MPAREQTKSAYNNQPANKGMGKFIPVAVEQDDVEGQVVRGTIQIKIFKVHALFNLGCIHSLITVK